MNNTITITPSGIAIGSPLVAGTQLSVTATGMEVAEGATLFLIVTSRFPDLLIASCPLSETTTEGEYAGTLYTATKQMALFLANARADEARSASIELVDTAHGASLARTTVPIYNSSLIPQPCRWPSASPLYVPGPAASVLVGTTTTLPPGSPATVENVGTTSDAVFNFGIPKGEKGDTKTPSDTPPQMDGTAAAGTSDEYARADHVHPVDTSRASAADVTAIQNLIPSSASTSNKLATAADIPSGQVNADWTATSGPAEILHKPNLATVATSGNYADLTNKPTIPAAQVNADWNAASGVAQILNKPTIPAAQVQSDWNEADTSSKAYIQNKPTIPSTANFVQKTGDQQMEGDLFVSREGSSPPVDYVHIGNTTGADAESFVAVANDGKQVSLGTGVGFDPAIITIKDGNPGIAKTPCNNGTLALQEGIAPAFSASSTYAEGAYCTHDGLLFRCTTAVSTAGAWDAANWTQVAVTDEMGGGARYSFAAQTPSVSGTSATVACEDRAINDFTVATGITSLTITPPVAVTGRARDFFCRVTLTDASLPTVALPAGQTVDIGQSEINGMTQGVNILMFTEIASGHWLASRRSAS